MLTRKHMGFRVCPHEIPLFSIYYNYASESYAILLAMP